MLDSIAEFVHSFQPKDWLTLLASVAAFTISVLSFRQKSTEGRQALRKQLTEVLQKLSELNTEIAKFNSLPDKTGYPPNLPRLINDQRRFFVRQAAYLTERIEDLVSPYEYLVIASAFDGVDDTEQAEHFFSVASKDRGNKLDQGIALRGFARFQYSQNLRKEGCANYQAAITCFAGESDRMRHYRGDTYERWANQEDDWSNHDRAKELLQLARAEYSKIDLIRRRDFEVKRVEQQILGRNPPTPTSPTTATATLVTSLSKDETGTQPVSKNAS